MRLWAAALAAGAVVAAAPLAHGHEQGHVQPQQPEREVGMAGRVFSPGHLTVLVGEAVTWRNDDSATHDIFANHGFDSGALPPGASYARVFDAPAHLPYICRIHRSMRGIIDVVAISLTGTDAPHDAGGPATLDALAKPGTELTLERLRERGPADVVATGVAGPDGRANFTVLADAPSRYRLRSGTLTSAVVSVRVAPRVVARARRLGSRVRVPVTVVPAQPGARVALEAYDRERFGFLPVRVARLDVRSRASFVVRSRTRRRLRVQLTRPLARWSRAFSPPFLPVRRALSPPTTLTP